MSTSASSAKTCGSTPTSCERLDAWVAPPATRARATASTWFGRRFEPAALFLSLLNPGNCGIERGIFSLEQRFTRQRSLDIRCHTQPFERLAAFGNVVCDRVLKAVAVRQFFEHGWQRGRRGPRPEDARPSQILQSAGQNL